MAAAIMVSRTAFVGAGASHSPALNSQLARFRLVSAASPKSLAFASRKQYMVRCDAEDGEAGGLKEAEDQAIKKTISKLDDILRNQENNESKKNLGFGTKPTSGSLDTSAEVENTPATDDVDFRELLALDGPLPETLSGRLAMFGMACAFFVEKTTGLTVFEQVFTHGNTGLVFFVGAAQLLTYASLAPIMKGESIDSRSLGPFTARAEKWNGRLAMIGFLSLIVTEMLRHAPVFQ